MIAILAIPFGIANADIMKESTKKFTVSGSSTEATARSYIDWNRSTTVVTNVSTIYSGTNSKVTAINNTSVNGIQAPPLEVSNTTIGVAHATRSMTYSGSSVYEISGSHSVYVGGVYKGGATTYTWW
ncbi:hypothetical protein LC085_21190 [Bacillus tianshenii]|uniref:hypothetical protein n=1 Tax=Sutcliffiella tianshenii TaxID=1463404 RepID=UPI001CD251E9|nr:hypothetical protein [Bacillus tianshenii]MCA1322397.1 hypothetical protein [Bacillus tianshenii]